jgi:hypothetical protein
MLTEESREEESHGEGVEKAEADTKIANEKAKKAEADNEEG